MTSDALPCLLTVPQCAEALAVSPRTIERLVKEKALPAVRIRGSSRIDRADLRRFIESAKAQAQAAGSEGLR